ncbi:MAG: dienelactone hydrolase family protein [Thermoplasmatales archaeon]|nr:dienelactone hydrolase family protein [Thermoplasmatales archaeon]
MKKLAWLILLIFLFSGFTSGINRSISSSPNEEWINGRRFLWEKPQTGCNYPVIIVLHAALQRAEVWFYPFIWSNGQYLFVKEALRMGYMVVAPDSLEPYGIKAWDSFSNESEDILFFYDILEWLSENEADMERIYVCGFSSGAFMASRLAIFCGDKIEGVVIYAGANADYIKITKNGPEFDCISNQSIPSNHSPSLIIHGKKDRFVPYECGFHYYEELIKNGIDAKFVSTIGGHRWQFMYNKYIFEWLAGQKILWKNAAAELTCQATKRPS